MSDGNHNLNATAEEPWSVNLWGSHPSLDNDDCWSGVNFKDQATAREFLNNPWDVRWYTPAYGFGTDQTPEEILARWTSDYRYRVPFFELDGPDIPEVEVLANPDYDARAEKRRKAMDTAEGRSEFAMQQGMAFGVGAYNEAMGYD